MGERSVSEVIDKAKSLVRTILKCVECGGEREFFVITLATLPSGCECGGQLAISSVETRRLVPSAFTKTNGAVAVDLSFADRYISQSTRLQTGPLGRLNFFEDGIGFPRIRAVSLNVRGASSDALSKVLGQGYLRCEEDSRVLFELPLLWLLDHPEKPYVFRPCSFRVKDPVIMAVWDNRVSVEHPGMEIEIGIYGFKA